MEIRLTGEAAQALVENINVYQEELDPADEEGFAEMGKRLAAIQMTFDDLLLQAGVRTDPLTELEEKARTVNPYYRVAILPNEGRKP
jgi:hypothetical protein